MNASAYDRRDFLKRVGVAGLAGACASPPYVSGQEASGRSLVRSSPAAPVLTRLSDHLAVVHGPINVGIVLGDGEEGKRRALLFDCCDRSLSEALKKLGVAAVDTIAFTHHHRDQVCGAFALAGAGARIAVPAAERQHFEKPEAYWQDPKSRWHIYYCHPHRLMLAEPLRVDAVHAGGGEFAWGPAHVKVLDTPGHTDGSVSYLVEVDGRRVLFCGDVIYDHGRLWDVHSLQKGFSRGNRRISDYHGFLGAQWELKEGLARIKAAGPDVMVPSHGRIMDKPAEAIDALTARLDACYEKYVAISALRHYFPELFTEFAGKPGQMPIRKGKAVPECLRHFGTTWMLVSKDKAALAMDCGGPHVVKTIQQMREKGEIRSVEGLWVTHYHDDHVDAVPEFQKAFDCPCITDSHVAEVISNPTAWRLPCISPSKARVDRATKDGESWEWHEFKLTAFHYPGQTLYHSALLAESGELKMLFVGDSHTPSGIDDYCAQNRNWLGADVGFDRCIALIEKLRPTHIFNCHVDVAFDFTAEECRFMRENLAAREKLFGEMVPWEHPNYATEDTWVRMFPYEQKASAGARIDLRAVVTNHSAAAHKAAVRAVLPRAWGGGATDWQTAEIPSKSEGEIKLSLAVPQDTTPGRYVLPIDVRYADWDLPQFAEAVVVL